MPKTSVITRIKSFLTTNPYFWPILIFLLAAVLRLWHLDLMEFKADESIRVFRTVEFYQKPYLATDAEVSSIGVYYPPFYQYLLIILGVISRNPLFLAALIALLNSGLLVFFYLFIKKYYNQVVAIIASFSLVFSPWSIIYCRKIWNPDLVLLFIIPALYFLHQWLVDNRKKALIPLFALLTLAGQLQFSGLYVVAVVLLILFTRKEKPSLQYIFIGIGIGLIPALPYFYANLTSQPFCRDCLAFIDYQRQSRVFDWGNLIRPFQFSTGLYFENLLGNDYSAFLASNPLIMACLYIFYFQIIILVAGVFYILFKKRQFLFLPLLLLLTVGFYIVSRIPAYIYYCVVLSPVLALIVGIFFDNFWQLFSHWAYRLLLSILPSLCILADLVFIFSFYSFINAKQTIDGDYGQVYAETRLFVDDQTNDYLLLPNYDELKSYAFVFSKPEFIHQQLGEYFMQKGQANAAVNEFEKQLQLDPDNPAARANLTYLQIVTGYLKEARENLTVLSSLDSTVSAQLETLYNQAVKQKSAH